MWKRYVHRIAKVHLSSFCPDINRKVVGFFDGGISGLCRVTVKEKVDFNKGGNWILPWRSKIRAWRWSTAQSIEGYSQKRYLTKIHRIMLFIRLAFVKTNERWYIKIALKALERNQFKVGKTFPKEVFKF